MAHIYQVYADSVLWSTHRDSRIAKQMEADLRFKGAKVSVKKIKVAPSYSETMRRKARKAGPVKIIKQNPVKFPGIVTKHLPASNTKPARIAVFRAGDKSKRKIYSYSLEAQSRADAHERAVRRFMNEELGWAGILNGVETDTGYVFLVEDVKQKKSVKRNPLKKGFTPKTIGENISHEVKHGKPHSQAIKIAYNVARREFKHQYPNLPYPDYLQEFDAFKKNPTGVKKEILYFVHGVVKKTKRGGLYNANHRSLVTEVSEATHWHKKSGASALIKSLKKEFLHITWTLQPINFFEGRHEK